MIEMFSLYETHASILQIVFFIWSIILTQEWHMPSLYATYSQSYGFPVVMWVSHVWMWKLDHKDGWAPKNDAFKLWCWRRFLRVPWIARKSNQSILKQINPEYSSEGLMLKPKLQYFGHLMQRTDSLEKTLNLGKTEGRERRGRQRTKRLDGDSVDMNLNKLQEIVKDREAWCSAVHGFSKNWTQLSYWATSTCCISYFTMASWWNVFRPGWIISWRKHGLGCQKNSILTLHMISPN